MTTEKKTSPKTEKKDDSGFTMFRTVKNTADNVSEKVKAYNDKYVAQTVEKGKKTFKEYNDKYVMKTVEKGRDTVKQYNSKYVSPVVEKGRSVIDGPYKKVSKSFDDALAKGREFEKDAMKRFDDFVDSSRKFVYKVPMVETIEKRVTGSLNSVPRLVNMPCKEDIEKLTNAMETLNSNIETMKKQNSA
ncbi:MAG: hypothetical protein U5L07_00580 [Desulfobacterales bacterium]|nr:hypothetical protein [Desulfobacterales bacterium]